MKRMHVYISGRVQGVFFRAETQRTADGFHLTGWVRNMSDGRVEALFEGEDQNVDKMLDWCRVGPPAAHVKNVLMEEEAYSSEFNSFDIRF